MKSEHYREETDEHKHNGSQILLDDPDEPR